MYALRNTGVDAFTLCDAVSTANWAAQDSFALSENTLAVLGRSSGDTIALATAARVTAALDSAWSKIIVGDYPEFYDSYNGYKRLISPTAFYLGTVGNLSPQFSPLNKQIRGVVSTGATRNSTAYSGSELSTANTGGVDVLVGPPTTPGGNYFTWETGRNTSSNMAMARSSWSRR